MLGLVENLVWLPGFATQRGLRYEADADERWFRAWEPYTTLRVALGYAHALNATGRAGSMSLARMEVPAPYPLPAPAMGTASAYAWVAIVQDERIDRRVAVSNDTGVLAEPRDLIALPVQKTDDAAFDRTFATFGASREDVAHALTPSLRKLLLSWNIPVHAELRPGGFIVCPVALKPDAVSLSWFLDVLPIFGEKASKRGS
jgi:hypothetical protein